MLKIISRIVLSVALLYCSLSSVAQKKNAHIQYHIHKAIDPIIVDGKMEEASWNTAEVAKDFAMVLPMDTSISNLPTEVRMTYDAKNIYILAICYK
ncbi:MAG: hypothetical protein RIR64_1320, partial [Bacteroidota bacterium]